MGKKELTVMVVVASIFLSAVVAFAQPCCPPHMWKDPELVAKIGLTDNQRDQVKGLFREMERKRIELRAQLQLKELELREAMEGPKVDEGRVRKLVGEIGSIRTDLHLSKVNQELGLRKILTPEQQEKLRDLRMMEGMMGERMGGMKEGTCRCGKKSCDHGGPCPKGH